MDPRSKGAHTFPVEKVDFDWIDQTDKLSELKKGYKALEQQGGHYPELQKKLVDKIRTLDPKFKRANDSQPDISKQQTNALNQEFKLWSQKMNEKDSKLRDLNGKNQERSEIFGKQKSSSNGKIMTKDQEALNIQQKAKSQKQKGNDFMKSRDFKEALACYNKSIELYDKDATTFSNRSLAYINLKEFQQAKKDADKAIQIQPDYLKAYHRLARSNEALGNIKAALKAFQKILRLEPQNKDAQTEIPRLRGILDKDSDNKDQKPREEGEFKRVQIEQDSQDDDESGGDDDENQKQAQKQQQAGKTNTEDQETKKQPEMERRPSFWEQIDKPEEDQNQEEFLQQIKAIVQSVNIQKNQASQQYKKGNFQKSLKFYNQALRELSQMPSGSQKTKIGASINNNIASCYKQMRDSHKVIEYTSKVIDSQVEDVSILGKAYCRRGFAQVELENFRKALNDLKQANKLGFGKDVAREIRNLENLLHEEGASVSMQKEEFKKPQEQTKANNGEDTQPRLSMKEIHSMIQNLKQQGNKVFSKADYDQAIVKYSLAIGTFRKQSRCQNSQQIKTLIKQCMSNRAQCYLKLEKYEQAIEDCSFILSYLDKQFRKCILRRGVCYNRLGKYELSIKDLQKFCKLEPHHSESKTELDDSVKKFSESLKRQKAERDKKQREEKLKQYEEKKKNEEAKKKEREQKKKKDEQARKLEQKRDEVKQEKTPEDSKISQPVVVNQQEPKKSTQASKKSQIKVKGKKISEQLLQNATQKAKQKLGEITSIPTSMIEFSMIWDAKLQNASESSRFQFLQSIPNDNLNSIFNCAEIKIQLFSQILKVLNTQGIEQVMMHFLTVCQIDPTPISKYQCFKDLLDFQFNSTEKQALKKLIQQDLAAKLPKSKKSKKIKKIIQLLDE